MVNQITNATLYTSENSLDTSQPCQPRSSHSSQGRAAHLVGSKVVLRGAIERDSSIDGGKLRDTSS